MFLSFVVTRFVLHTELDHTILVHIAMHVVCKAIAVVVVSYELVMRLVNYILVYIYIFLLSHSL